MGPSDSYNKTMIVFQKSLLYPIVHIYTSSKKRTIFKHT